MNSDDPILYILRGISGSGKTTLTRFIGGYEFSADDYFTTYIKDGREVYNFDPSLLNEAHRRCQSNVEGIMKRGLGVTVHNTFTTEKEIQPYLDLAEKYGYVVISLIVENRHGSKSVHDVPEDTLIKQEARLRGNIKLR